MKRAAVTLLGLLLTTLLASCGSRDIPSADGNASSNTAASSTITRDNPANSTLETTAVPTELGAEQPSEFGGTSSVATDNSTLASLKISELPAPPPSRWKEGENYKLLVPVQPTNAKPGEIEVAEVFWYGCPHCLALDPYLESWRKNGKAGYVSFVRIPVMWGAIHRAHARVFYTADLLGKLDTLHTAIFNEIQTNHNPLQETEQVKSFFVSKGVSAADFQKAYSSFGIDTALKQAEALGLRYKVESVPLIIINGKYLTDVGMAGGREQLIALINHLAAREHGTN